MEQGTNYPYECSAEQIKYWNARCNTFLCYYEINLIIECNLYMIIVIFSYRCYFAIMQVIWTFKCVEIIKQINNKWDLAIWIKIG